MIFWSFDRALKVTRQVIPQVITYDESRISFDNGRVILQAKQSKVVCGRVEPSIILTKPTPDPFVVINAPASTLNPDKSFSFTPQVKGGVGSYSFHFSGVLPSHFVFNSQTGQLSCPAN